MEEPDMTSAKKNEIRDIMIQAKYLARREGLSSMPSTLPDMSVARYLTGLLSVRAKL
jgi:hypothetical protein